MTLPPHHLVRPRREALIERFVGELRKRAREKSGTVTVKEPDERAQLLAQEQRARQNADQAATETAPLDKGAQRHAQARLLQGIRVLVVDDATDARELLGFILSHAGATVEEAASASAAIAALRAGDFDVLVSDIGMPEEDGYAMMRRLRAMGPDVRASGTPALALTAYTRAEDRRQALAAGFQMHMAKPIEPRRVVDVVAYLVGRAVGVRAGTP